MSACRPLGPAAADGEVEDGVPTFVAVTAVAVALVLAVLLVRTRGRLHRDRADLDVLRREGADAARDLATQHAQRLTRHAADVVLLVDPSARITFASESSARVLGRGAGTLRGRLLTVLAGPERDRRLLDAVRELAPGQERVLDLSVDRPDGSQVRTRTTVSNDTDDPAVEAFVVTVRDVTTELTQAELALRDPVTGLSNRRAFTERVADGLAARGDDGGSLVVLVCDLDDFKAVNDRLGHAAGDQLLAHVAQLLVAELGPGDTVARTGGDEFAALLEHRTTEEAEEVAQRVVASLRRPVRVGDTVVEPGASVGLAQGDVGRTSAEEVLRNADVAMYWAKDRGRSTYAVYDPAVHEQAIDRLMLRSDLQRAIRTDELRLVFQPTIDLRSGDVRGFEALCRWDHPLRGVISPSEFVPIAEETGMVHALDSWVLVEACRVGAALQREDFTPTIAVNVSSAQLSTPEFVVDLLAALDQSGLSPDRLLLEITETSVLRDVERVIPRLAALRTLGVRVAVDDFGTGYSSLAYLSRLPLDVLKIDKSFVDRVLSDAQGASVAQAVLDMSNSLGLTTVGEGVESPDQATWLREAGCTLGQGYLWSRPVNREDIDAMLADLPGRVLRLPSDDRDLAPGT
jgi:diguanylate cyclase (GGDEF)-like protein/PAS domain S-box-containing protein